MLGSVVDYLHRARVPFRLASYPSEESRPIAAHRVPAGGMLVEVQLFTVDMRPVLVGYPSLDDVDERAISAAVGGLALPVTNEVLAEGYRHLAGAPPPLGQLFGLPVVLDERVATATVIVFRPFDESVFFEIPYEDYARLEQPRLASFASAGALEAGAPAVTAPRGRRRASPRDRRT